MAGIFEHVLEMEEIPFHKTDFAAYRDVIMKMPQPIMTALKMSQGAHGLNLPPPCCLRHINGELNQLNGQCSDVISPPPYYPHGSVFHFPASLWPTRQRRRSLSFPRTFFVLLSLSSLSNQWLDKKQITVSHSWLLLKV